MAEATTAAARRAAAAAQRRVELADDREREVDIGADGDRRPAVGPRDARAVVPECR